MDSASAAENLTAEERRQRGKDTTQIGPAIFECKWKKIIHWEPANQLKNPGNR